MSCKSAIYTAMTAPTAVAVGGTIPLGTVIRRFGCNCQLSGNGITVDGPGYYEVNASVTLLATAAGDVTVTMYKDGVPVPGATATETLSAIGNSANLNIASMVRLQCCDSASTLTFVLTGTANTVSNVGLVVKKV